MGDVHDLVLVHGKDEAMRLVPPERRDAIEIAARVLADDTGDLGYAYSGFALTSLPYSRLASNESWIKRGHQVELAIDPVSIRIDGKWQKPGVPFGARGRVCLIWLQTQAVRQNSPAIELGGLRPFVEKRLGMSWGGEVGKGIRDQFHRLAACSLRFAWATPGGERFAATHIIRSGHFSKRDMEDVVSEPQLRLWEDEVVLDEGFFRQVKAHAIPLKEEALRSLADEALALDIYVWLAYRFRVIERNTSISWESLHEQFGQTYKSKYKFRERFLPALDKACAAYPDARVSADKRGITLTPSLRAVLAHEK